MRAHSLWTWSSRMQDWETIPGLEAAIIQAARQAYRAVNGLPETSATRVGRTFVGRGGSRAQCAISGKGQGDERAVFSSRSARRSAPGVVKELGDIALAYETMVGEAHESGIALLDHVRHLVVHGILHLLGHDHETETDAETYGGIGDAGSGRIWASPIPMRVERGAVRRILTRRSETMRNCLQ